MAHRRHIKEAREALKLLIVRLLVVMTIVSPVAGYGEEEGGAGGGAGAILEGIAKNIEAAAPIAVAGVQAAADKQIAQINASAQLTQTQIAADTSKYLADIQTRVALYQAKTAQNINQINQESQTQRLGMQLNELASARREEAQDRRERLAYEKYLNDQRIALAKQQQADNVKLARATLQAQLVQAGLSSGFTDMNSGSRLKVTRTYSSGAAIPTTTMSASKAFASAAATPVRQAPALTKAPGANVARGIKGAVATAPKRDSMLSRLMAGIKSPGFTSMRAGKVLSRGMGMMRFASVGGPLKGLLAGHLAAGSSAGRRHRIVDTSTLIAGSDSNVFRAAVQMPDRGPASFAGIPHRRGALSGSASDEPTYSVDPASFGSSVPSSTSGGGHRGHSGHGSH